MAEFTITIPDAILDRVIDGYGYHHGYPDEVRSVDEDGQDTKIPNPESKIVFARRLLERHIKRAVASYEARLAEEQAREDAVDSVNLINITVA